MVDRFHYHQIGVTEAHATIVIFLNVDEMSILRVWQYTTTLDSRHMPLYLQLWLNTILLGLPADAGHQHVGFTKNDTNT